MFLFCLILFDFVLFCCFCFILFWCCWVVDFYLVFCLFCLFRLTKNINTSVTVAETIDRIKVKFSAFTKEKFFIQ